MKLIWRGLGTLPGMGPHPGIPYAVLLILMGAAAGADKGHAIGGATVMAAWVLPALFLGAYSRAKAG